MEKIIQSLPLMSGIDVVLFIIAAIAVVGLSLFFQQTMKPGHIFRFWYIFLNDFVPYYLKTFSKELGKVFFTKDSWVKAVYHNVWLEEFIQAAKSNNSWYLPKLVWKFTQAFLWYCVFCPLLLLLVFTISLYVTVIAWTLKQVRKSLGLCIYCNSFWLALGTYWYLYGLNLFFFIFLGIMYLGLFIIIDGLIRYLMLLLGMK